MRTALTLLAVAVGLCGGCAKQENPKESPRHDIAGEVESIRTHSFQGERRTEVKRGWNIDIRAGEGGFNVDYVREYTDGGRQEQYSFAGIETLGEIRANPQGMIDAGYTYIYFG